ncbi:VWA domain-containing protein [Rhodovulum sp. DZ06]|uniref:VWA domain-containing protein n=1 Tax=Rhodovulum sp. DZ06 TaxID=3425126 RepID=UPI003D326BA2
MPSLALARAALLALGGLAAAGAAAPTAALAADRLPKLVEGKTTIYQRVLAKDEASLFAAPGGARKAGITPFQPLYVYDRKDGWIEVGRGVASGPEGWAKADDMVEWKQNIVVSFANPAGRERQIFFEDAPALEEVVQHEAAISMARELRRKLQSEGAAEKVVSIEPAEHVDILQNFYLLPILDWREEEHPMTFEIIRLLELASLPLGDKDEDEPEEEQRTAGVVFVIDTSRSMQPYIEATRDAVKAAVERIQASPAGEHTRFGLVGFRDSVEAAKAADPQRDIEYRTRTFLALSDEQTPGTVNAKLSAVKQATASTIGFNEDAASGVWEAINMPGWENAGPNGGPIEQRYVVVISDAGPKRQGDASLPEALRELDAGALREAARSKKVQLAAIHIKTSDGVANHAVAAAAYAEMTRNPVDGSPVYEAVDLTGGADPYGALRPRVESFADFVIGEYSAPPTDELQREAEEGNLSPRELASLAMRLEWHGRRVNAEAPPLLRFWAMDKSLENPLVPALDVRLLITKNELSTMADVLREISTLGEMTQRQMREDEFFELLRGALARMAQNPGALVNAEFGSLDDAVAEYLDELPYSSSILAEMTPERWANASGAERRRTLDRVKSRLQLLEHFNDDPALWTALYEGAPSGEHVFALPLEALP